MASKVKVDTIEQQGSSGIVISDDIKLSSGKAIKQADGTDLLTEAGLLTPASDVKLASGTAIKNASGTALLTQAGVLDNVSLGSSVTGKGLQHIKTITASGVTNVAFVNGTASVVLDSTYEIYKIFGSNIVVTSDGTYLRVSLSTNAGVGYTAATAGGISGGGTSGGIAGPAAYYIADGALLETTYGVGAASAGESVNFEMTIYNPAGTSVDVVIHTNTAYISSNSNRQAGTWMHRSPFATADVDAIKIDVPAGNISGIFQLYGLKSS